MRYLKKLLNIQVLLYKDFISIKLIIQVRTITYHPYSISKRMGACFIQQILSDSRHRSLHTVKAGRNNPHTRLKK